MNALHTGLKALACGMGALAITAVMSWSFVQSTATAPGATHTASLAKLTIEQSDKALRILHAGSQKLPGGTVILCPVATRVP